MPSETFSPTFSLHPDFESAANWSGGYVPGGGALAVINAVETYIDPLAEISASVTLMGGAVLIGNQSGFAIAQNGVILATDSDALYANGAIVNQGVIAVSGLAANLTVVVQAGSYIASAYGLTIASFENAGTVSVDHGANLDICGTEFSNLGTVTVDDASLSVTGGWVDGGQGRLTPGGVIALSDGGVASFADGVTDQQFDFNGPGTIIFADPLNVSNVAISNFGYRDAIITSSTAAANALLGNLFFTSAPPAGDSFAVRPTANGAEILLVPESTPPCFAAGTGILTPAGYVPVEALQPGALVLTAAGVTEPVRWIGWREIDLLHHARPDAVRPVRITKGALAASQPSRDLILSPDHALFLHGQLVPAKLLVNGATIRREAHCRRVSYFHIELDRHDIIIAENLAVETYIDTGNRNAFSNSKGKLSTSPLFGRGRQWNDFACAELCLSGPVLAAIRREIFARVLSSGYRPETDYRIELRHDSRRIAVHNGPAHAASFKLPTRLRGPVTIRSATFIPAEFAGGTALEDDWRRLGIAISRIRLDDHSVSLGEVARAGVHPRGTGDEAEWTDGDAMIDIPPGTSALILALQAFPKRWAGPD